MKRKILCLDGGGIKGLYSAEILTEFENAAGGNICDYFDMISGTSTGGIIAAGLALGIPAEQIRNLYKEQASRIFPQDKKSIRFLRRLTGSKYQNDELKLQLERIFGDATIGDCKTRLLIPSYNLTSGNVQVFKTDHARDLRIDYRRKIVDVLLSTTAAPTYLPPHSWESGTYIDGGIGANNPSLLALVEAISKRCDWGIENIYLLSIGTMKSASAVTTGREQMGMNKVAKLISLFMSAESQYSDNIVRILLGTDRYLRINDLDIKDRATLDKSTPEALKFLQAMGKHAAKTNLDNVLELFLDSPTEEFKHFFAESVNLV